MKKNPEKKQFSKALVVFCIVFVILYITASLILQYLTSISPSDELTRCVFIFFGVELLSMAGIKVSGAKYEHKSLEENVESVWEDEDIEEDDEEDFNEIGYPEEFDVDYEQLTFNDIIEDDIGPGDMN